MTALAMSSTQQKSDSIFRHKGWNRLVVIVALAYVMVVAFLIVRERTGINVFDQFDRPPPRYAFWGWSASAFLDTGEHRLVPRASFISAVLLLPPVAFAFVVYSVLWIHRGFRASRQLST